MPSAEPAGGDRTPRRGGEVALTITLFAVLMAVVLPVLRVARPDSWLVGSVLLAALVLAAGFIARRFYLPAVAVTLIEVAVFTVFLTFVFLRDTALLWLFPTPETIRAVPGLLDQAFQEISLGSAPLAGTEPLAFLIVGSMGLLAIIVDHVVVTARMPLLASIGIVAVSLIPAIAVPRDADVPAFIYLAVAILALLRAETRSREAAVERVATRTAGVPATALGIGAVAIIVAVVATPLLPTAAARPGGFGASGGIDATLQLGDDLRRPAQVDVLRVWSDAPSAPYLRATTLSRFEGSVWVPDLLRTLPLNSTPGLGPVTVGDDVQVSEYKTTVQVTNLSSRWAPVSYPAVKVKGLVGTWSAVPYNRTVVAQNGSTQGQTYEVQTEQPRPTLEQIRALPARSSDPRDQTTQLPAKMPAIIEKLAREVTADATNDYDRLIALQRWFRGGDFEYSLDAPVEEGFDGSGADAVAKFLEVRSGYCVHFASAFALMARTLGMPSRIVVGYLPGTPTGEVVDDEAVYTVSSQLLHAWPEVYFEGLGWMPFEPTTGLGVPTAFAAGSATIGGDNPGNTPSPTPQPSSSSAANGRDPSAADDEHGGPTSTMANPLPGLGILLGILLLLALPAIAGRARTRQLAAAARNGDAAAAWLIVQNAAIDLAIVVPGSETPRAFAGRLVALYHAPSDEMDDLLRAIEHASYSSSRRNEWGAGPVIADAALAVRASLMRNASMPRRILAVAAPRSLIIRPGSAYAAPVLTRAGRE